MRARVLALAAATALLLSACSSEPSVPDDQVVKPASVPSKWSTEDLGVLSVSAPASWDLQPATKPAKNITSTTWRTGVDDDGRASGGLEVKVITDPQAPAEKAAESLAVSALATLRSGTVDPLSIVWPDATDAWYLAYTATVGLPDDEVAYPTRTMVLDLDEKTQVQVTVLTAEGTDEKVIDQVLTTVKLTPAE